jgi:hypothetical protein
MSFKAGADGVYSLMASQLESFTSSTAITLEDLKLEKFQNLMQNPTYTFSAAQSDDEARFLLHFGGTFSVYDKGNTHPVAIYVSGNSIFISNNSSAMLKGEVIVYNMTGQSVMRQSLCENTMTKINLNGCAGYYLVKVIAGDRVFSEKVFID